MNIKEKICTKCGAPKPLNLFKNGNSCIWCEKQYLKKYYEKNKKKIKAYQKRYRNAYKDKIVAGKRDYYQKNKEKVILKNKEYVNKNKEKVKRLKKEYYLNNKEEILKKNKIYAEKNKHRRNERNRNRRKTNIYVKLREHMSKSIHKALKKRDGSKCSNLFTKFLPYTIDELKLHLESLFEPWMNWGNHGQYNEKWNNNDFSTWKWQIDHIVPHSKFNYAAMGDREFQQCWDLKNLRPLSAKQNWFDGITRRRHK